MFVCGVGLLMCDGSVFCFVVYWFVLVVFGLPCVVVCVAVVWCTVGVVRCFAVFCVWRFCLCCSICIVVFFCFRG